MPDVRMPMNFIKNMWVKNFFKKGETPTTILGNSPNKNKIIE